MKNIIPGIEQKITRILKKINLKPKISAKKFIKKTKAKKHRYLSLCTDPQDKKVIFYARLHKNPDAKEKMKREISFFKKIKKRDFMISKYLPKIYLTKIEKDFEWFTREYFPSPPLGTNEQLKEKMKEKDAKLITEAVCQIKDTPLSFLKDIPLKKFPVKNYLESKNFLPYLLKRKILSKKEAEKVLRLFQRNTDLIKKENKYFSHGDFNLGNLIISNGTLKIIDWESIQINNLASDIAYFFTHLWQAKKSIRRELIKTYLKLLSPKEKTAFKKLFPIVIFYLAAGGIETKPSEIKTSLLKKRKEFFKKLIKKSFSFKELIRI